MDDTLQDELLIRRMVERWALWRDAGDWERFASVWHPDSVMMAPGSRGVVVGQYGSVLRHVDIRHTRPLLRVRYAPVQVAHIGAVPHTRLPLLLQSGISAAYGAGGPGINQYA